MSYLRLEVGGRIADGVKSGRLWIAKDGLDGWWDSTETLFDEDDRPDGDGAFDPVDVPLGPRRVNVALLSDALSTDWA